MTEIMVKQWSFCPKCKGRGCKDCDGKGTVFALIPLDSLSDAMKGIYAKAQADFIREQKGLEGGTHELLKL